MCQFPFLHCKPLNLIWIHLSYFICIFEGSVLQRTKITLFSLLNKQTKYETDMIKNNH